MKKESKIENESKLLNDKKLRDTYAERIEVLDKVKQLMFLPGTEFQTVKQVADYYEVGEDAIVAIYSRHSDELLVDGMCNKSYKDFSNLQYESLKTAKGKVTFIFKDGTIIDFPTRGQKVFPRRAILRVGMLLRDSEIAKEVRTQLLNIEEKASIELKVADIEEEQSLMMEVGRAVASGDANAVAIASTNLIAFKNRHIEKLENDNKGLAGEILEWSDRNRLNAGVRKLASVTGIHFSKIWNELYKNLQYKYRICLKQRGGTPYIQWIDEDEWKYVLKVFCAMCEAYKQSPTEMFQQTTPKENLHNAS
ncbi:hypothetical protein [Enterocloster clostridioformis]|uniref:Uncharacterized protein n=1 Tax=Enterocloster clostridioformis TaxID=1531 RepID=A0AAP9LW35_9FIRM|nr:hypothetical protein [Enterocloster clostridioformis]EHG33221.1 hypothetical protein HMPREF9467_00832 [ [[Clostridium] clostridioforme 2_1_49FAA]QIX89148.1 hypothetical protein FOC47_00240 [Enterocloster clostridioformis]